MSADNLRKQCSVNDHIEIIRATADVALTELAKREMSQQELEYCFERIKEHAKMLKRITKET